MSALVQALGDGVVIARRNLIKVKRVPDLIVGSTVSPIMFVLLFAFVFGGSISVPGIDYREFLMAGIFAQTVVFGSTVTGTSLAEDLQKGVIDRFRSLPMAQSAVLVGRTVADVGNNLVVIVVMSVTGLLVGWRIRSSPADALLAFGLLLVFAFGMSWVMAVVGMLVRTPEVVNNISFIVIFPLTFIANTFVPSQNLPPLLRVFAEWNPVSALTQAVRGLFGNTSPQLPPPQAWSLQHPVAYVVIWTVLTLVVFVPLSTRLYRRAAAR